MNKNFKSGYVTIVGLPNVGKSTLLNCLLGEKLVITSHKPQTTRNVIRGIFNTDDCQVVFVDTPGIHYFDNVYNKHMTQMAIKSLKDIDLVFHMVDASQYESEENIEIAEAIRKTNTPAFLIINKMDKLSHEQKFQVMDKFTKWEGYKEYIPISAINADNIQALTKTTLEYLPEGPPFYPQDILSDSNERFIVAELVREKILKLTHSEIPHAVAVQVEQFKERDNGTVYILANIYVEKKSQKSIVIGDKGQMLKQIGQYARQDIERFLDSKVYLELYVKVRDNWRKKPSALKDLGYI